MANRSTPIDSTRPSGFQLGKEIELGSPVLAVDQSGGVHCVVGYLANDQPDDLAYMWPSVAARDRGGRESSRFVRLARGTLATGRFLRDDIYYRIVEDRRLVLPTGAQSYFGVTAFGEDWTEDEALTQAVFGGTMEEIALVATSLAKLIGRESFDTPRVTFSKTRSNRCDLTNALIPREFPYLAFQSAQYDWSHVSLHGFYRLLSLTAKARRSPIRRAMINDEVPETLLDRLIENSDGNTMPLMVRD